MLGLPDRSDRVLDEGPFGGPRVGTTGEEVPESGTEVRPDGRCAALGLSAASVQKTSLLSARSDRGARFRTRRKPTVMYPCDHRPLAMTEPCTPVDARASKSDVGRTLPLHLRQKSDRGRDDTYGRD